MGSCKIFDCADKWEIRFSDVFSILSNAIGRDLLKEAVRIQQVRDIYGIRAVDEIRKELKYFLNAVASSSVSFS